MLQISPPLQIYLYLHEWYIEKLKKIHLIKRHYTVVRRTCTAVLFY